MPTREDFQDELVWRVLVYTVSFEPAACAPGNLFLRDLASLIEAYLAGHKYGFGSPRSPAASFFLLGVVFPVVCFSRTIDEAELILERIRTCYGAT
ncbi:MAG: hypothetical protein A3G60_03515 [Candidatus Ryanbacteria bacterium RIFCSPLOWO2_12_FULL_47_9c]|uniref:Uncharacterized protein n=2 Tax=Candidatus Ryaniibacteriota TaxID=1817914 RepID=A0A1G2H4R7_9BACT|nr:MAG: hypothetical protein UX74_C0031G0020 [Parcubacteria group bacterium GW2011_GWA2_47_10b]KKU85644.1 MAG: hypothetical protein UY14_C0017G0007 [Parcubacteria group bacterium GW2011_GWA1_47_9]OGZ46396.1 MAG: hypothetical protein A2844_01445 [Candidatus Ryanbacteria bacterium RIFCSPHIGHO2_01_FULL_48_80]OGZ49629.1 MAG: hypothetical protein A3C83_01150 [Candidatus Ryanbacteria bacterium RIFCSPHIGHO2_02_FULL_47_25]OGZ52904.1 MAG: hypothetical protein A3A29_01020 [Candidatus Ryanbacteria bacteri